jgi:DNA-binding IclR family transcriptional regulator
MIFSENRFPLFGIMLYEVLIPTPTAPMAKAQRGIQSVEIGLLVAKRLAESRGSLQLKELAAHCGFSASKTHRYLVSLVRAGIVRQVDGRYDLGPTALELGLAALARIDVVRTASAALATVRDRTGETAFLAIWGHNGPTIVRWEESGQPVTVNVRVGSIMPLLTSATGRLFAAFLPPEQTKAMLNKEIQNLNKRKGGSSARRVLNDFQRLQAKIRTTGLSPADGTQLASVSALSAPIFDVEGRLVAVITSLGSRGDFDCSFEGTPAKTLLTVTREISAVLGYAPK